MSLIPHYTSHVTGRMSHVARHTSQVAVTSSGDVHYIPPPAAPSQNPLSPLICARIDLAEHAVWGVLQVQGVSSLV